MKSLRSAIKLLILWFKIRIQIIYKYIFMKDKPTKKTNKQENFNTPNKKPHQEKGKDNEDNPSIHLRDLSPIKLTATANTKITMQLVLTPFPIAKDQDFIESIIKKKIDFQHQSLPSYYQSHQQDTPISSSIQSSLQEQSSQHSQKSQTAEKQQLNVSKIKITHPVPLILQSKQKTITVDNKRITCNCKKTKCLKLYCDCFRDNQSCGETCNCVGCHNNQSYEIQRMKAVLGLLQRDPDGFKQKYENNQHSKGCNCKKSHCQKKYCECYQAGLACGDLCKCQECKNNADRNICSHKNTKEKMTAKKEPKYLEQSQV